MADLTSTIKTLSSTNPSSFIDNTLKKYANPANVSSIVDLRFGQDSTTPTLINSNIRSTGVPVGAQPDKIPSATAKFDKSDIRSRLTIPSFYAQSNQTKGPNNIIANAKSIIFPYTPTIQQDYKATYASVNTQHSNYTMYFYKNSSPGEISLSAKFTVQDYTDAHYYLSVIHILRSLIKMRFGVNDDDTGAPPPVCRLYAYGSYVMDNVPVSLQSFSIKLDDNIDYFSLPSVNIPTASDIFSGINMVPVMSTIQMSFIPMYSRREMMNGGVKNWLNGTSRQSGLL